MRRGKHRGSCGWSCGDPKGLLLSSCPCIHPICRLGRSAQIWEVPADAWLKPGPKKWPSWSWTQAGQRPEPVPRKTPWWAWQPSHRGGRGRAGTAGRKRRGRGGGGLEGREPIAQDMIASLQYSHCHKQEVHGLRKKHNRERGDQMVPVAVTGLASLILLCVPRKMADSG